MKGSLAKYTTEDVEAYFRDNPKFLDTKRGYETLTGLILAKAHQQIYGSQAVLGFELESTDIIDDPMTSRSLDELFVEGKLADRDADVCVAYEDTDGAWKISRIQVTRVEERVSGDCPFDRLLNLIRKKALVQNDPTLQLAVLIDETFDLELPKLSSELRCLDIPYARVYLICQIGVKPIPNIFVCYEVYPGLTRTEDISVQIGQESSDEQVVSGEVSQTDHLISGSNGGNCGTKGNQAQRGKIPIASLKQAEIIQYIRNHPETLDNKKMHELVIGWLLSQFFTETEKDELYVGFPLKPDWERNSDGQITLAMILEGGNSFIEDRDIDIFIGKGDTWQRCQVTRFLNPNVGKKERRLADLIAKKCRTAPADRSIAMVISVESHPHITMDELRDLPSVPFGLIILIMKASQERGHFTFCQLYPEPVLGKEIRVPLPV